MSEDRYSVTEAHFESAMQSLRHFRDMPTARGVYLLVNVPTGRVYVGSSSNMRQRATSHIYTLRSGASDNKRLAADFKEHGEDSIRFAVLAERSTIDELKWTEWRAIALAAKRRDHYNRLGIKYACHAPRHTAEEIAAHTTKRRRSITINDARWDKLKRLGIHWLERAIDRAKEPK